MESLTLTLTHALRYRSVLLENRAYQQNLEHLVQQRTRQLSDFLLYSVQALCHALEARDPYTQGHGYRVGQLVLKLAEELGVSEEEHLNLRLAAELHDIGKIGISDSILLKEGPLSTEEYTAMKEHVSIGYRILSPIPSLHIISEYVFEHHERIDGKGYPRGLNGNDTHYNSRLLMVSEVFDALATRRCYKPAWPKHELIQYFTDHAGTAYDTDVAHSLISILHREGDELLRNLQDDG